MEVVTEPREGTSHTAFTSAPSAENWGILDKPLNEPARPKSEIIEPMRPCHG